jgi:hypothetical protein
MVRPSMRLPRIPLTRSARTLTSVLLLVLATSACKSRPSDLREWRPSDHSHEEGEGQGDMNQLPPEDNDPLVAAMGIWQAQCTTCHGPTGHGDGPQAMLTHPPDLTSAAFQSAWTDDGLRASITNGRNMMPGFGSSLRPEGIDVLVRLVRTFGRAGATGEQTP